jgi:hypothetical protein
MVAKATGTNKTTPQAREDADKNTFSKEFLVWVDDSSNVPDEIVEVNKPSVVQEAEQRGLRANGEPKLESKEPKGDHSVLLTYILAVKSADETK